MTELHGEESERLVGVSTSCWSSLQNDRSARLSCKTTRQREGLGEVSWNHHDSKPKEEWSHSLIERQVRRAYQALLPTLAHSFVACGRAGVPHAPACETVVKVKVVAIPSAQGLTHTHTHKCHQFDPFLSPTCHHAPNAGPPGRHLGGDLPDAADQLLELLKRDDTANVGERCHPQGSSFA